MSGRRRRVASLAAGSAGLLGAAGLGAALDGVRGGVALDRLGARILGPPSPVSGPTAITLAQLSDRGPTAAALVVLAAVAAARYRSPRPVLAVAAAAAATQGVVLLGKRLVDRTLFSSGTTYPSGHVAGATAVLVLAVLVVGGASRSTRLAVGGGLAAVLGGTSLGALWTQSHVLTDVIGGGLAGAGAALVAWSLLGPAAHPARPATVEAEAEGDPSVLPAARRRPPGG